MYRGSIYGTVYTAVSVVLARSSSTGSSTAAVGSYRYEYWYAWGIAVPRQQVCSQPHLWTAPPELAITTRTTASTIRVQLYKVRPLRAAARGIPERGGAGQSYYISKGRFDSQQSARYNQIACARHSREARSAWTAFSWFSLI